MSKVFLSSGTLFFAKALAGGECFAPNSSKMSPGHRFHGSDSDGISPLHPYYSRDYRSTSQFSKKYDLWMPSTWSYELTESDRIDLDDCWIHRAVISPFKPSLYEFFPEARHLIALVLTTAESPTQLSSYRATSHFRRPGSLLHVQHPVPGTGRGVKHSLD